MGMIQMKNYNNHGNNIWKLNKKGFKQKKKKKKLAAEKLAKHQAKIRAKEAALDAQN